jgi:hypothetical protein
MDKQQMYGIMSMEDIEQAFNQIERRIGIHERDVIVLEERCKPMTYDETFTQFMREHFARVDAERAKKQDKVREHLNSPEFDADVKRIADEIEPAQALGIVGENAGGADED